jgi:hypothetical protein
VRPLEQLFHLEVEFYRKLRCHAIANLDAGEIHTSYALQCGYEQLLRAAGPVTPFDIKRLRNRLSLVADARDLFAASDSVTELLGFCSRAD